MPRAKSNGNSMGMTLLKYIVLFPMIVIGILIVAAGFIWGIGGIFWSTFGVVGLVAAMIIIFMFVALPLIILMLIAQKIKIG